MAVSSPQNPVSFIKRPSEQYGKLPTMTPAEETTNISYESLRQVTILSPLSNDELAGFADSCSWSRHDSHYEVVVQDTPCDQVYFIAQGRVSAKTYSPKGREVTYAELGVGEFFGELSALDNEPHVSFVITLQESLIASIDADAFNIFLEKHPAVMRTMLTELAGRVRRLDKKILEFSTLTASNRIHAELLRLAKNNRQIDGGAEISPTLPHADLASRTNGALESVTRELARLKKNNIIRTDPDRLFISDIAALTKLIENE